MTHFFNSILISLFIIPNSSFAAIDKDYPAKWWKPVPRDQAASWEILPQDAKAGEVILSKRTELGIFSNFAATPFELDGIKYKSLEGFWQMMKYPENKEDPRYTAEGVTWKFTRKQVAQMTAFEAKNAGKLASKNMKIMDINWVSYKGKRMDYRTQEKGDHYKLIIRAMKEKLAQNTRVKDLLFQTGDLILKPDHKQGDNPPPAWKYHEIWMNFRSQLNTKRI